MNAEMKGKVCIVTGANGGIGKATAAALAQRGATVILACRDQARGEAAKNEIISATGNSDIQVMRVDLANQESIREMVTRFYAIRNRLDVLVNTAAVFKAQRTTTPDGLETMFAVNHLGVFRLTNLLLDTLTASAPSRVLVATAPSTVQLDFDDLQGAQKFRPLWAFGASKMCNLLFTYELARRLEGTGVTVNAVHPGLVKSNLMREAPPMMRWVTQLVSSRPEKPAAALARLASSPEVAGVTGKFFKDGQEIESSPYSHDRNAQRRLWDTSVALTDRTRPI
ncbi:MAG: SDR family oxidoreductase [Chloroflexi bacterium]|nr:SDR family oxidoreductase [Chloroflexota bacterium]